MVIKSSDYYHLSANWSFVCKYVVTYTCKGSLLMGVVWGSLLSLSRRCSWHAPKVLLLVLALSLCGCTYWCVYN